MDADVRRVEALLCERMSCYFPQLSDRIVLDLSASRRAAYSTVYFFRVSCADGSSKHAGIVVKVFAKEDHWMDLSKMQFATLRSVWPLFEKSPMFGLPRPLDYFSDPPALVMEEVAGRSLQKMFRSLCRRPWQVRNLIQASHGCGKWLRHFHEGTRLPPRPLDVTPKRAAAQENLAGLAAIGFSTELLCKVETSLDQKVTALSQVDLPAALVHGDFTVDNVLIDRERICVVDLTGRDQNAIYHDLATFLNSLAMLRLSLPIPTSLIRSCGKAFLSGYFTSDNYNRTALEFIRLTGLVSVIIEILNRRGGNPIARWWIQRFFAGVLRSLVDGRAV